MNRTQPTKEHQDGSLNILVISPKVPFPPDDGGKIVIFNTIKHLALQGHTITLFALCHGDVKPCPELDRYCTVVYADKNTQNSFLGALFNLFSMTPYNLWKYHSRRVLAELQELVCSGLFDVVHVENLHMAYYGVHLKDRFKLPVFLREHNVESTIMKRFYQNSTHYIVKLYAFIQYRKILKYEKTVCAYFDKTIAISRYDAEQLRSLNPKISTDFVTAGMDDLHPEYLHCQEEEGAIIYVGSLAWRPNVEAVLWFCETILPSIIKQIPVVKFYIVGGNPPQNIRELAGENVVVTGYVKDPGEYIAKAQVYVVPLLTGSGMRIKILEALSMKKALVTTTIGCEGISLRNGEDAMIVDQSDDFAAAVVSLLESTEARRRLADSGNALIRRLYSWNSISEKLSDIYRTVDSPDSFFPGCIVGRSRKRFTTDEE